MKNKQLPRYPLRKLLQPQSSISCFNRDTSALRMYLCSITPLLYVSDSGGRKSSCHSNLLIKILVCVCFTSRSCDKMHFFAVEYSVCQVKCAWKDCQGLGKVTKGKKAVLLMEMLVQFDFLCFYGLKGIYRLLAYCLNNIQELGKIVTTSLKLKSHNSAV